jgi:hypothetical protein
VANLREGHEHDSQKAGVVVASPPEEIIMTIDDGSDASRREFRESKIDSAIEMVAELIAARPQSSICIDVSGEWTAYRVTDGVLTRASEPVLVSGERHFGGATARDAFVSEGVFIVQALQNQVTQNIKTYREALGLGHVAPANVDRILGVPSPRRSLMQPGLDVAKDAALFRFKVSRARALYSLEAQLASAVLETGREVADALIGAGVPDAESVYAIVASLEVGESVSLLKDWPHWNERYQNEMLVNWMLDAVAASVCTTQGPEAWYWGYDAPFFGYQHSSGQWFDLFDAWAWPFDLALYEGVPTPRKECERQIRFGPGEHGELLVQDNGFPGSEPRVVKDRCGTRDDLAIDGLMNGIAFDLVWGSLVGAHGLLDQQYAVLASSPLMSADARQQLEELRRPHADFRVTEDIHTPVTKKNIGRLVGMARETYHVYDEALSIQREIAEHATQVAERIREQRDTGEPTVDLGRGWEIRTHTRPPAAFERTRVIVHSKCAGQPVEPVPWIAPHHELTGFFLLSSGQMLGQPSRPPVRPGLS